MIRFCVLLALYIVKTPMNSPGKTNFAKVQLQYEITSSTLEKGCDSIVNVAPQQSSRPGILPGTYCGDCITLLRPAQCRAYVLLSLIRTDPMDAH